MEGWPTRVDARTLKSTILSEIDPVVKRGAERNSADHR